jgi:4-hydroxyphenylpyruvate dioxygenase
MMRFNENALFLNTVLPGGTPEEKVRAAAEAGFSQLELWQQDVERAPGGVTGVRRLLQANALSLTDYQVLLDFDGAPDAIRPSKRAEALQMLDTARALGADTLLAPASTDPHCVAGREAEDLRWLAREAAARDLRIAFEAMAWSRHINNTAAAWGLVQQLNEPNLGLVVDAFHLFVLRRTVDDLAGIPMEKIFLVQLSDLQTLPDRQQLVDTARHRRLLPGEGNFPLDTLLDYLAEKGYRGPLGLEVFNDALNRRPPGETAGRAMAALKRCLRRHA